MARTRFKRWRKRAETWLVRFALMVVPRFSRKGVVRWAAVIGWIAARIPLRERHMALANLDIAFSDSKSATEKRAIYQASCRTFALVLLDIFWFSRDTRERVLEWTTFDPGLDELFQKKAHLCVTAHLGNWELLGHAVSVRGYPLSSVAAPLVNPAVDVHFAKVRKASGQIIIPREGALRTMLRTLKEQGKVGVLLDQNTPPHEGGVFVDFFGLPAPMSDAAASLALKTQADVLFGFCIPDETGKYYVHTASPIRITDVQGEIKDAQTLWLTRAIAKTTEEAIRTHPGAWLWMYRRWRYIPEGADRERFPFYAKK